MFDYRSMFDLTGRTALVVGAGSGIGEAGAHGLASFGATVYGADVNVEAAERTAEEARSQGWLAEAVELDMRDSASVRAVAERVGTPDVLVSTPCSWTAAGPPQTGGLHRPCREFDNVHIGADTSRGTK